MTKNLFAFSAIIITTIILFSFAACHDKSRDELILGKWRMAEEAYGQPRLSLQFNKDKTSTVDRIINGQSTFRQSYNYELIDDKKYLLLEPTDKNQKEWKVEIVQLACWPRR